MAGEARVHAAVRTVHCCGVCKGDNLISFIHLKMGLAALGKINNRGKNGKKDITCVRMGTAEMEGSELSWNIFG